MAALEKRYARAIYRLASAPNADHESLARTLRKHLAATGREKLLPRIVFELNRLAAAQKLTAPHIEVATEAEASEAKTAAAQQGIYAEPVVVPNLIRGWRASAKGIQVDTSAKRMLIDMYRSIAARA